MGVYWPVPVLGDMLSGLSHPLLRQYLVPVVLPMGLFNVLGSLQNIESAEAAGDRYPTMPSLAVNGAGSIVAAAFGSCFPTTIYIGHPGWKQLGARAGYSVLNGVFFAVIALGGLTYLINALVPMEAGMAIVLWIGIVITAQAFQATPSEHAPAVAIGLFPAIAAWGLLVLTQTLGAAGGGQRRSAGSPRACSPSPARFAQSGLQLDGLVALSQGFMVTCMVWSAMSAHLIDRQFRRATAWAADRRGRRLLRLRPRRLDHAGRRHLRHRLRPPAGAGRSATCCAARSSPPCSAFRGRANGKGGAARLSPAARRRRRR